MKQRLDLKACREVLEDARELERWGGCCYRRNVHASVFLTKWAPRLLDEVEELREYKSKYEGLCK